MSTYGEPITDLTASRARLARRGHGVIVTSTGQLEAIYLRRWPKWISWPEVWPVSPRYHVCGPPDRCQLFFNQPRRMPSFLALKYLVSTEGTRLATVVAALAALDAVAECKRIDAIVCDAANLRLSDQLLARFGWQPHKPQRWHRNYIRRFYGSYPHAVGARFSTLPAAAVHPAAS